ncbi:hypothetical protein [Defluviitalea raffinosedens]|uniref:hypothetical protein n=1 Tax=Defluviitalea raffinosedens TaxID=1450156 RepID=UPI00195840E7|nr:hypothetical protein [Defluviitalea raffinosedens]MBM7685770.1 hypothetical protein [Defluviitalea raffinosedens]
MKVSRSIYYKVLVSVTSKRQKETERLKGEIRNVWMGSKSRYDVPKIHKVSVKNKENIILKCVQRYMADMAICSIVVNKFNHHSDKSIFEEKEILKLQKVLFYTAT